MTVGLLRNTLLAALAMVPVTSFALYQADRAEREAHSARALTVNASGLAGRSADAARDLADIADQERGTGEALGRRAGARGDEADEAARRGEAAALQARVSKRRALGYAARAAASADEAVRAAEERAAGEEVPDELPADEPTPAARRPTPGFRMAAAPSPLRVSPGPL